MDRVATPSAASGRKGQGRPAALALAWLRDAPNHIGDGAKASHGANKSQIGGHFGFALRAEARRDLIELATASPDVADLLRVERDPYADEDDEPEAAP